MLRTVLLILMPVLAVSLLGLLMRDTLHTSNLALLYMAAVIVTAVRTSTIPALISAISGFLAFNFFFTAPRGTFLIHEREDMLTAALFLLIALLVGPLAARRTRLLEDLDKERIEKERELLRSALLSSVSHDFRTPLTSMIGATSTLMEMGAELSQDQQRELLESVLSEAERLDMYTQNLLDMTRLGQGELKLDRSWISIAEIINVTLKRIRPLAENHRLKVTVQNEVPLLRVHPALIEQALFNVLHNALKFSPSGTTVSLEARIDEDSRSQPFLAIDISDEGPGIEEMHREDVFKMFHTAPKGDRRVAGTGLGLAICRGMIGAHGGTVEILSPAGVGCTVHMTLPIEKESIGEPDGQDTGD